MMYFLKFYSILEMKWKKWEKSYPTTVSSILFQIYMT